MTIHVRMAWRNVWRNRRRSLLTIAAIAFACALLVFMLSFQFGTYEAMINAALKVHTGYFQVQDPGYLERREIRQVVEDPAAVARLLAAIPEVTAHTFRANAFSLASSEDRTYGADWTDWIDGADGSYRSTGEYWRDWPDRKYGCNRKYR